MKKIFLVGLASLIIFVSGCISGTGQFTGPCETGSGNMISKDFEISGFTGVVLEVPATLFVTQGPTSLRIEAENNIIELINVGIQGGRLRISSNRCFSKIQPINVHVSMEDIDSLAISGSGKVIGQNKITAEKLVLSVAGSGSYDLEVDVDEIRTDISGSGKASLRGSADSHNSVISGSGDIRAFDLITKTSSIRISGSGNGEVHASQQLDITITGSGTVLYKGNAYINQNVFGSGKVRKV
jgi:hypothetical protein